MNSKKYPTVIIILNFYHKLTYVRLNKDPKGWYTVGKIPCSLSEEKHLKTQHILQKDTPMGPAALVSRITFNLYLTLIN